MADPAAIGAFVQQRLATLNLADVSAVEAAAWLDTAGLLKDSVDRPGKPLRDLLRDGVIAHARQEPNRRWFILKAGSESGPQPPPSARRDAALEPSVVERRPPPQTNGIRLDRAGLVARGFGGFTRFKGINLADVPSGEGVYVVLREIAEPPVVLDRSPAGWFKGRDPTVVRPELERTWTPDAHLIYIGMAGKGSSGRRGLRKRIQEFRRFGDGEAIAHSGGRRIWQLADSDEFTIGWILTPDFEPGELEAELIREFAAHYGRLPFGNRTRGSTKRPLAQPQPND